MNSPEKNIKNDVAPTTCLPCLRANLTKQTRDPTAYSDIGRPHCAYQRGFEEVKGERFDLPVKKFLCADDFDGWFRQMASRMQGSSLSVYRGTLDMGLRGLHCSHGGWGGDSEAESLPPLQVLSVDDVRHEYSASEIFASVPTQPRPPSAQIGFKLSVCQKSLSLALKHSYAHGAIGLPPVSPVDRIILDRAPQITGRPWFVNWTEVNDLDDYDRHIELLTEAAGFREIAAWELMTFENLLPRVAPFKINEIDELRRDNEERLPQATESFLGRFGVTKGDQRWPEAMLKDALRSSLQHNATYLPSAPAFARIEVRQAMRRFIIDFLGHWAQLPLSEQDIATFREWMLKFQAEMNLSYGQWFR
jgi:hypothetical protein